MSLLAVVLNLTGIGTAKADTDYCIRCVNPDETYVCRVTGDAEAQGQQLFCIMNIAQQFHHDSCQATAESQSCSGRLVEYHPPTTPAMANAPTGFDRRQPPAEPTAPTQQQPAPGDNQKPPDTLVEFSKQTVKKTEKSLKKVGEDTGKAIENTGDAISETGHNIGSFTNQVGRNIKNATTTTFKCLTTLFSDCKSGDQ